MQLETATKRKLKVAGWIALGVAAALWFYFFYPAQHPYSLIESAVDKKEIRERGNEKLTQLGYDPDRFTLQSSLRQDADLINRLQRIKGRSNLIRQYKNRGHSDLLLPLYHWQANMESRDGEKRQEDIVMGNDESDDRERGNELHFKFSQKGELIELHNEEKIAPTRTVDRSILQEIEIFPTSSSQTTLRDSVLQKGLYFSVTPSSRDEQIDNRRPRPDSLRSLLVSGERVSLDEYWIERMARAQLERFYWSAQRFEVDSIYAKSFNSMEGARIEMQHSDSVQNHHIHLEMDLVPTGSLFGLSASYREIETESAGGSQSSFWQVFRSGCLVLIAILVMVLFYRRLKSRVVDTKSALVVALVGGLLLPLQSGLFAYAQIDRAQLSSLWEYVMVFVVMVGLAGTLAVLTFFVLTGVSESLTRQAWSRKLEVYNLVRQGLFLNKPVGYTLLNAAIFSFVLAAALTLFLQLVPSAAIELGDNGSERVFYEGFVTLPPLFFLAKMGWISLLTLLLACTTIGSVVYNWSQKVWLSVLGMAATVALLPLIPVNLNPPYLEIIAAFIIGLGIAAIFLYREAVTALLSLFLFLLLIQMDSAWLPALSPDRYFLFLMAAGYAMLIGFGALALIRGQNVKQLPDYVPDYVEELAREERMKQELDIAKQVQQDFLPLETPAIEGWQVGAVCKPAYETGGDYYDFIRIDEDRIGVAIGDVSGKGIKAAFYMTFVKGVLHSLAGEINSPSQVLQNANRLFYKNAPRGTFISLVYGIINLDQNRFRFARAGHNPVLYKSTKDSDFHMLRPSGIGLGMDQGGTFDQTIEEQEITFDAGDLLILYTDGMVEAVNHQREFFGNARFLDTFKSSRNRSAEEIITHTTTRIDQFTGSSKQHDDMTMIVIQKE